MNNDVFELEKLHLEETNNRIVDTLEDFDLRTKSLPRMHGDNPRLLANLMRQYKRKISLITRLQEKPYFARIDFKSNDEKKVDKCYIGKVGIIDPDNNIVTTDWRSPIATLYYDSNIGNTSYIAPSGKIEGNLLIKRQIEIEESKLKSIQDIDTVSNDEILKPYLGVTRDNRLKNIVASIQQEQNSIIRESINQDIIVQGVAGSGKTTVALHRVAYLVYNNIEHIKPEQYMVIGPNNFFLNYIESVLPDLDVNDAKQTSYKDLVEDYIEETFELIPRYINTIVSKYKESLEYKTLIDKYIDDYENDIVPLEDLEIEGFRILKAATIKEIYDNIDKIRYKSIKSRIDKTILLLVAILDKSKEELLGRLAKYSIKEVEKSNKEDIRNINKKIDTIKKEINSNCQQLFKRYFKKINTKTIAHYKNLIDNIEKYTNIDEQLLRSIKHNTLNNIKNKTYDFSDLPALLYLKYKTTGNDEYNNYKHTVIDEAQDFGVFHFYSLKEIMTKSTFSIFGDIAQSIYKDEIEDIWNKVNLEVFNSEANRMELLKSYRTTIEIMNEANKITRYIGIKEAIPVIRHGESVMYKNIKDNIDMYILTSIKENIKEGHKSIAIIVKNEIDATMLYEKLIKEIDNINLITSPNKDYNGGICIITANLAKGLEFDSVIIEDASENEYSSNNSIDMKLLYVALTRALHNLEVLYKDNLNKALALSN